MVLKVIFAKLKSKIQEAVQTYGYDLDLYNLDGKQKTTLERVSHKYSEVGVDNIVKSIENEINNFVLYDIRNYDNQQGHKSCDKQGADLLRAKVSRKEGKGFSVADLRVLERHLYLTSNILGENKIYYEIIANVNKFLPCNNYYDCEDKSLKKIMSLAIDLYLVKRHSHIAQNYKLIDAVKYFKLVPTKDFEIELDTFAITQSADQKIFKKIEEKIIILGAYETLFYIFKRLGKMKKVFGRYPLYKIKNIYGSPTPIPYQFLIHLACKHMKNSSQRSARVIDTATNEEKFLKIIDLGQRYITLLEVYDDNLYSDFTGRREDLMATIKKSIVLENLCFPVQYCPNYIKFIMKKIYFPNSRNIKGCPQFYNTKSFYTLLNKILSLPPNYIINLKDFGQDLKISHRIIVEFLNHFSQNINVINNEYTMLDCRTNLYDYPLIKIDENNFYLLSAHFCGYAFCKVFYDNLLKNYSENKKLSIEFGKKLELVVREAIDKKGYKVKKGLYCSKQNKYTRECDTILESNSKVVFVEIKNSGLSKEFELFNDVSVLQELAGNALYAQKQILRHKLYLLENDNKMDLFKSQNCKDFQYTLNANNKRIYAVSLCGAEVHFFTTGCIFNSLLQSLPYARFSTINDDSTNLEAINKLAKEIHELVEKYIQIDSSSERITSVRDIFFSSTVKSLQQFWYALDTSNTIDEFIDNLVHDTTVKLSSGDYYSSLNTNIGLRKYKNKKVT